MANIMNNNPIFKGINWYGGGFIDLFDYEPTKVSVPYDSFDTLVAVFHSAVDGDFESVPKLIDIIINETPSPVAAACVDLFGCTACSEWIEKLKVDTCFFNSSDLNYSLMRILMLRGTLRDVIFILEAYVEKYKKDDYSDVYPIWISQIIDNDAISHLRPEYYSDISKYEKAVRERVENLSKNLEDSQASIVGGQLLDLKNLSEFMVIEIEHSNLSSILRLKYEAYTGVDCTKFYSNRVINKYEAISTIMEYLDSNYFPKYVRGARYFFGDMVEP